MLMVMVIHSMQGGVWGIHIHSNEVNLDLAIVTPCFSRLHVTLDSLGFGI
jgi:hypothetical protein